MATRGSISIFTRVGRDSAIRSVISSHLVLRYNGVPVGLPRTISPSGKHAKTGSTIAEDSLPMN